MQLYEVEGKELLREAGFTVPEGLLAASEQSARSAALGFGFPVVLKAQVLAGGRGKAGLVAIVRDESDLGPAIARLFAATQYVLVERFVEASAECYAAITIAEAAGDPVLLLSPHGGIDVEASDAGAFVRRPFSPDRAPWPHELVEDLAPHGIHGKRALELARAGTMLAELAIRRQCTLAEINPLFFTADDKLVAGDAKFDVDDEAEIALPLLIPRTPDPLEVRAAEHGLSFTRLEGDIGVIVGGAGLAMFVVDSLVDAGMKPANFLDLQGSSTRKLTAALEIVGSLPGIRGIIVNNHGGLASAVSLATGIVEGAKRVPAGVEIVVKLRGTNQEEAWKLLATSANVHVSTEGTTEEAVALMASLLQTREAGADVG